MKVTVVAVGRIKHQALRDVCADYERRIRRYVTFDVREVREGGARGRDAEAVRRAEAESVRKVLGPSTQTLALTRDGIAEPSRVFARRVGRWLEAAQDVAVLIGGAHGLDQSVIENADSRISLSSLTLSHDIARLVFLEQLYRACTILRGEPYHKSPS